MKLNIELNLDYYLEKFANNFIVTSSIGFPVEFYADHIVLYRTDYDWEEFSKHDVIEWLEDYFPDTNVYPTIHTVIRDLVSYIYDNKDKINHIAQKVVNEVIEHNNSVEKQQEDEKTRLKQYYDLATYQAPKGSIPIVYKGVTYASRKQCQVLNDLTNTELQNIIKCQKY